MEMENSGLSRLLKLTQRKQYVNGKPMSQVHGCILQATKGIVSTTSLVRDGVSSLSRFSAVCDDERTATNPQGEQIATIPILDIDKLLGILSMHSTSVTLRYDGGKGKLQIKSGKKQTTIVTGGEGRAFTNSPTTLNDWEENSRKRATQIRQTGYYMNPPHDEVRKPFATWIIESNDLYEALRCDSINGQRLNRYTFTAKDKVLSVAVGAEIKGRTEIQLGNVSENEGDWEATFEGGLDNVFVHYTGKVILDFLDFRPEGQGIRMIARLPTASSSSYKEQDFVLQAGLI